MSASNTPNIGTDLLRTHSIITRGLDVVAEKSQLFTRQGFPDAPTHAGFTSYVRSLVSVLDAHHLLEDELAFPYLRDKLPDVPYELLMAQHQDMVPVLGEIRATLEEMSADAPAGEALSRLSSAVARIADIWHPHIRIEEEHITVERIGALMDLPERVRVSNMFAEHSQKHAGPDYLVVPFFLYNLPAEERAIFAQTIPPIVTQHLVPVVWKEKWSPMLPFLLP